MNYFYAAEMLTPLIDAGIVPEQPEEEFTFLKWQWLDASREEIESLRNLRTYTNQEYFMLEGIFSDEVKVRIRYSTPCITSLREVGT